MVKCFLSWFTMLDYFFSHDDHYTLTVPTIAMSGMGSLCGRVSQLTANASINEDLNPNSHLYYQLSSGKTVMTNQVRLLCPGDFISLYNLKYWSYDVLEIVPNTVIYNLRIEFTTSINYFHNNIGSATYSSIIDAMYFQAFLSEDAFFHPETDVSLHNHFTSSYWQKGKAKLT